MNVNWEMKWWEGMKTVFSCWRLNVASIEKVRVLAVSGQPRAIYAWVSTTSRSNYWSLSVAGHTFYRLNYPLRLHRWYHSCASWNGLTGEWQLWVNAERVGRGFHNRVSNTLSAYLIFSKQRLSKFWSIIIELSIWQEFCIRERVIIDHAQK